MKISNFHLPKSFLDLAKGHLLSQLIGVFSSVLIAKIYGPSALGVFSVFFTISAVLSTLNTARLECILFLDQERNDQHNNSIGLIIITLFFTIVSLTIFFFIPQFIVEKYFVNRLLLLSSAVIAFLTSLKNIFQNLNLLQDNYSKIKNSKIIFTILRYGSQFLLFYLTKSYWGLIIGYSIAIIYTLVFFYNELNFVFKEFKWLTFKTTINKYKDLLKYALPGDITNTIAINIFPILLIAMYSDTLAGNYFMSHLILSIPLTFLHSVVSPVFFKTSVTMVKAQNPKALFIYTTQLVKRIFLTISLPLIILMFYGEELIVFFFKEEWRNTGRFIEIFAVYFAFRVLYSPISSLEESLSKNKISLLINIYFTIILFGSFYLWKDTLSIFEIAFRISITTTLGYLFLLIYFFKLLHKKANLLLNK